MIPRKRLDIGWGDIAFGIRRCLSGGDGEAAREWLENSWPSDRATPVARAAPAASAGPVARAGLACLSVRSGFDALLQALDFPEGSEVLVSAVTIRDMPRIVEEHGLVPVPVDLDMRSLAVRPEALARAVTPKTKAILVAHVFGSRAPLEPVIRVAKERNLVVFEDCAQAYTADDYRGHPASDVSMFSFGPIKTATALGGGILCFRDAGLRDKTRECQSTWPTQGPRRFLKRLWKYAYLIALSYRPAYSLFVAGCHAFGKNHDQIIAGSVRGFAGSDFFAGIRQKPSAPLLALLERRLKQADQRVVAKRVARAQQAISLMPALKRPGDQAAFHSHWVFPILHAAPEELISYLWSRGFDATRGASSMAVVEPPADRPETEPAEARQAFAQLLYLPVYGGLSPRDVQRLANAVGEFGARKAA